MGAVALISGVSMLATGASAQTCPSQADIASTYQTSQQIPFSGSGSVVLTAESELETVYNHNTNSPQVYNDLPDSVVSAFHNASCSQTTMIESQIRAYRQVGTSLNTLGSASSTPVYQSAGDTNYGDEKYHEWLAGAYTDDGTNIYALVHDEWYDWITDSTCQKSNQANSRIDNVTLVVSNDGGATFHHPANYKVFRQASQWKSSYGCDYGWHVWGPSEPSNIVKQGGYYYATYWQGNDPVHKSVGGTCVARTADITNAGSWQVHTSGGWVAALNNDCTPISILQGMHAGLAWSTHLNKFVIVGSTGNNGYYYISTSPDMVSWSSPEQILNYATQIPGATPQDSGYPTLMDPSDTSMTFQNIGQDPYIYLVVSITGAPANSFNIVRQQVHFQ